MNTLSRLWPHTGRALTAVTLAGLASICHVSQAGAAVPTEPASELAQESLRSAVGQYQLADGRVVSIRYVAQRLMVRVDDAPAEAWQPRSADLLVSPDGQRRLRLLREADGRVDRVALELDRAR